MDDLSGTTVALMLGVPLAVLAVMFLGLVAVAGTVRRGREVTGKAFFVPDATRDRARTLLAQGGKIAAIKAVRDDTGLGLADAKRYVEGLYPARPGVPDATRDRVLPLIRQGQPIKAIKEVRRDTGLGLREAKEYVDALQAGRIPASSPGMLSERVRGFLATGDRDSAIALVRAETGMSDDEAARFVEALG